MRRLIGKLLHNHPLCSMGHAFVGVFSALMAWYRLPEVGIMAMTTFLIYELSQQYSKKKDKADEEIREALLGLIITAVVIVLT